MAGETEQCRVCGRLNRIPVDLGTRGIRCGSCRNPLATPEIDRRLHQVRTDLARLQRSFRFAASPQVHEKWVLELRRQQSIMRNLPVFPGYMQTKRARLDLVNEIEAIIEHLMVKADTTLMRLLRELMRLVTRAVMESPRQLLP